MGLTLNIFLYTLLVFFLMGCYISQSNDVDTQLLYDNFDNLYNGYINDTSNSSTYTGKVISKFSDFIVYTSIITVKEGISYGVKHPEHNYQLWLKLMPVLIFVIFFKQIKYILLYITSIIYLAYKRFTR